MTEAVPQTPTREAILEQRLCIIYRGLSADACVAASQALYEVGVRLFEVTFNSDEPETAIARLRGELPSDARIGAGTVMSAEDVQRAADAGAEYIISPHFDAAVVAATVRAGLTSIPGALSPTEIVAAVNAGADLVKVFPLRPVGGGDYIRQLRGPLPDVPLFASGGVDLELARAAMAAGCSAIGVGVQLLGPDPADLDGLTSAARGFLSAVGHPAE